MNTFIRVINFIVASLILSLLSGCIVFPESRQVSPEISGVIMIDDKPAVGVRIIESFSTNAIGTPHDIPDRVVRTDSEGKFYLKERRINTIVSSIGDDYSSTKVVVDAGQDKWVIHKSMIGHQTRIKDIYIECDFHPSVDGHYSTDEFIPNTHNCREITEENKFIGKTKNEVLEALGEPANIYFCRDALPYGAEVWEYNEKDIGSKYRLLFFYSITKSKVEYARERFFKNEDCIDMPER